MRIDRIYLITWVQRTTIHLKELFDFFQGRYDHIHLDAKHLEQLRKKLLVDSVEMQEKNDFETIVVSSGEILFSAVEDGVYSLAIKNPSDVVSAKNSLESYYSTRLGPTLSYLYSRGAPLPKRLGEFKDLYPIVIVVQDATENEMRDLYSALNATVTNTVSSQTTQIFLGDTVTVVRFMKRDNRRDAVIDDLVMNMVFFQEYYRQLRSYLNFHRKTWNTISDIRESSNLRYKDFPIIRRKILDFQKELLFTNARLNQMEDIAQARYLLLREQVKSELQECQLMRFDNATADLRYMKDLWNMTMEYAKETLELLESLFQENTQRELNALKFVTMIGVLTGFFGMNIIFPWQEEWQTASFASLYVVIVMILVALVVYTLLRWAIVRRTFHLGDKNSEVTINNPTVSRN